MPAGSSARFTRLASVPGSAKLSPRVYLLLHGERRVANRRMGDQIGSSKLLNNRCLGFDIPLYANQAGANGCAAYQLDPSVRSSELFDEAEVLAANWQEAS